MNTQNMKHLLVVSKETAFRKSVLNMLQILQNVCLHQADDIQGAWHEINDEPIDLVLIDEQLGDGSGSELLQKIKWSEEFSATDVLLFFDQEDEDNISMAMEMRASDYMVKPVASDVLFYKLEKLYGESLGMSGHQEIVSVSDVSRKQEGERSASPRSEPAPSSGLKTFFQPILDIAQRRVCGFEALTRVVRSGQSNGTTDGAVPSPGLFDGLSDEEIVAQDQACRMQALSSFAKVVQANSAYCLYLNVSRATVELGAGELVDVVQGVRKLGIPFAHVVLEIDGAESVCADRLKKFMTIHRNHGFRIAFDRYDGGRMHLNRVVDFRPDMVKLSGDFTAKAASNAGMAQVVSALIRIAQTSGTEVTGTGVEREDDAIALLRMGLHTLQGYYFDRPHSKNVRGMEKYHFQVEYLTRKYIRHCVDHIGEGRSLQIAAQALLEKVAAALARAGLKKYPAVLQAALRRDRRISGAFVLDKAGVQIVDAVSQSGLGASRFCPPAVGTLHFLRDYYLHVVAGYERYVTPVHFSAFSDQPCRIMAQRVPGEKRHIVCIELIGDY